MTALETLEAALGEAAGEVALERPSDAAHGDYATNVAMRLAGARRQRRGRSRRLVEQAAALRVERAEIAGPGFVNLWLTRDWYGDALAELLAAGGATAAARRRRRRVQVEMVSANPTGPITVASARNGAYGDSVARLLAFAGTRSSASTTTTPARRWSASGRRSGAPPRRGAAARTTTAPTSPSWRRCPTTRCRRC